MMIVLLSNCVLDTSVEKHSTIGFMITADWSLKLKVGAWVKGPGVVIGNTGRLCKLKEKLILLMVQTKEHGY